MMPLTDKELHNLNWILPGNLLLAKEKGGIYLYYFIDLKENYRHIYAKTDEPNYGHWMPLELIKETCCGPHKAKTLAAFKTAVAPFVSGDIGAAFICPSDNVINTYCRPLYFINHIVKTLKRKGKLPKEWQLMNIVLNRTDDPKFAQGFLFFMRDTKNICITTLADLRNIFIEPNFYSCQPLREIMQCDYWKNAIYYDEELNTADRLIAEYKRLTRNNPKSDYPANLINKIKPQLKEIRL